MGTGHSIKTLAHSGRTVLPNKEQASEIASVTVSGSDAASSAPWHPISERNGQPSYLIHSKVLA
jgi:hypothetical protein